MSNRPEHPDGPFDDDLGDDLAGGEFADGGLAADELPKSGPGSLAPVWARGIARVVDMFIVFSAASVVLSVTGVVKMVDDEVVTTNSWTPILVLVAVWCFYEIGGTIGHTRMVGKMLLGLRVRAVGEDRPPRFSSLFMRWLLPAVILLIPLGSLQFAVVGTIYLSALLTPRLQGFHDRVAHTLVVRIR